MRSYLAAVFALTFGLQIPALFLLSESILTMLMLAIAGCMPGLVALALALRTKRFVRTPNAASSSRVFVAALAAFAIPMVIRIAGALAGGGLSFKLPAFDATTIYLVTFVPIFEELGWRGFLQPRCEEALRWTLPRAAVFVGVVWALWHLPMSIQGGGTAGDFLVFALALIAASVWIAALVEHGGGRVWIAMIAHASMNFSVVEATESTSGVVVRLFVHLAAAFVAVHYLRAPIFSEAAPSPDGMSRRLELARRAPESR